MGKENLIGKGLWESYSKKVQERMNNPLHRGSFTQKDADEHGLELIVADYGDASCGDSVQIFWLIDKQTGVIKDARFLSFGCGTAIASSDMMAGLTIGKTVDEAAKITNIDVEKALRDNPNIPAVPGQKMHCSVMAYDVIKRAVATYKNIDVSEIEDQEIVCECAQVSLGDIVDAIRINDLKSVEKITEYTKAGGYCKSCIKPGGHETRKYYLEDILKDTREKIARGHFDEQKSFTNLETQESVLFTDLSPVKKIKIVENVLAKYVAPILAKDKGGVELADVIDYEVKIIYKGACQGCASASTGTLNMIESILRERIDADIKVTLY